MKTTIILSYALAIRLIAIQSKYLVLWYVSRNTEYATLQSHAYIATAAGNSTVITAHAADTSLVSQ